MIKKKEIYYFSDKLKNNILNKNNKFWKKSAFLQKQERKTNTNFLFRHKIFIINYACFPRSSSWTFD
jgi:hypothetical protein